MRLKNYIKSVCALLLCGAGMTSCGDNEIMTYEDVARIYFKYADTSSFGESDDQILVNMGYDVPLKEDSIIEIPIKLMGRTADVDRDVKAVILANESTATEGEDIEIISASLPAHEIYGSVKVKLNRTENITKNTLYARICLRSNDNFHTDYNTSKTDASTRNGLIYTVYFTALAEKPSLWAASGSAARLNSVFGEYSNGKLNAICEACGVTRAYFDIDPADNDATGVTTYNKRFPNEVLFGLISMTNRYLTKYKEEHGEPLMDEYGNEVKLKMSFN